MGDRSSNPGGDSFHVKGYSWRRARCLGCKGIVVVLTPGGGGTAQATIEGNITVLSQNQSTCLPPGRTQRLAKTLPALLFAVS